jgi:hypothetical protein
MFFFISTAEWLHLVLYFSTSLQNIIIPERTHYSSVLEICIVDIRSEAWLNLFWEYINGKLFAVYFTASHVKNNAGHK